MVAERGAGVPGSDLNPLGTAERGEFCPTDDCTELSLSIIAKDFQHARMAIEEILLRHHGYAAELTMNTEQNNAPSLQAALSIPAVELAESLVELKLLGTARRETQKGEEVRQPHSDLLARLKNSRETEQRLQSILQERTGKMSDVLELEQEISRVRGEIEGMEAILRLFVSGRHRRGTIVIDSENSEKSQYRYCSLLFLRHIF